MIKLKTWLFWNNSFLEGELLLSFIQKCPFHDLPGRKKHVDEVLLYCIWYFLLKISQSQRMCSNIENFVYCVLMIDPRLIVFFILGQDSGWACLFWIAPYYIVLSSSKLQCQVWLMDSRKVFICHERDKTRSCGSEQN